mgnify:CR=1 FL=1
MGASQTQSAHEPTPEQVSFINELQPHVQNAHFNERTGHILTRIRSDSDDDFHKVCLIADRNDFEVGVYSVNEYSVKIVIK